MENSQQLRISRSARGAIFTPIALALIFGGQLATGQAVSTPLDSYGDKGSNSLTVTVAVVATDPNGLPLHYQWRSTDGRIVDTDSATTTWTLPDGPGLHFAYVLASNGAGGYIERRVAVNTDTIGTPVKGRQRVNYRAPAAPVPAGEVYRSFIQGTGVISPASFNAGNIPDVLAFAQDANNTVRVPAIGSARSNVRGEFILSGNPPVPVGDLMSLYCGVKGRGAFPGCGESTTSPVGYLIYGDPGVAFDVTPGQAVTDYIFTPYFNGLPPTFPVVAGSITLADGTACGTVNEFFGVSSTGTATLLGASGAVVGGPSRISDLGQYTLASNSKASQVLLKCEGAAPQTVPIGGAVELGVTPFPGTGQPAISSMTATLGGNSIGIFLPPPTGFPSDVVPSPERYLSYKGIDARTDACAYYKAIGAASGCDESGNLVNTISFDDWQRATQMGKYAPPGAPPEFVANYINRADLNLARTHHSISYNPNHTAAYVCNHLGPKVLDPDQAEIDAVVDTLVNGQNLVACVAMDYAATPAVNDGLPFVRFLIFGPSGQLLPSVNLDGRREKFVPGTCVVCHGGDHYAGHYLAHDSANVGAHYLPYDTGNFEFSSKAGLQESDQEEAIYNLNQNVLKTNSTVAEQELIAGWYATSHVLDRNYTPLSWQTQTAIPASIATNFYQNVVARSCRGCHVSQVEGYNWDHFQNINITNYRSTSVYDFFYTIACNGGNSLFRSFSMPNSLVTFNRYWGSAGATGTTPPGPDQVAMTNAFLAAAIPDGIDPVALTCIP
jgi:hypothetical protein